MGPGNQEETPRSVVEAGLVGILANRVEQQRGAAELVEAEQAGGGRTALHGQRRFLDTVFAQNGFDIWGRGGGGN